MQIYFSNSSFGHERPENQDTDNMLVFAYPDTIHRYQIFGMNFSLLLSKQGNLFIGSNVKFSLKFYHYC